ncbi:MAG: phage/plasmid replication protein [Ferruginibacter sp.]
MIVKTKVFSIKQKNTKKQQKIAIPMYNNRDCGNSASDFGCDKLRVFLNSDQFAWKKERLKGWAEKTITSDSGISTEYFYNPPALGFNLDIKKDERTREEYLSISTNPSKILHPFQLTNDSDIITEHMGKIETHLKKEFGMEMDMEQAKVSRFDLAHNIELNHPISEYQNVLNSFRGKRQITKTHNDTFYWANKTRQGIFYNKHQELSDAGYTNIPENLVRMEYRILNGQGIETTFKDNKLSTILLDGKANIEKYNDYIKDSLFRQQKTPQPKLDFGEMETMYENAINQYGTKEGHRLILESIGIKNLAENGGLTFFNRLIDKFQSERTARNLKKRNDFLLNIYNPLEFDKNDNSFISLNNELRHKLLVAA